MKLYDLIKKKLQDDESLRYDDRSLTWEVWKDQGLVEEGSISASNFMKAENTETIRRTRQKVQEDFPVIGRNGLSKKELEKGTFVYRKKIMVFDTKNNTVRYE